MRSSRGINFFVVGYIEWSKILQLYDAQICLVLTARDVILPESIRHLESIKIELPIDVFLDLDSDVSWTIEQKADL
jgi:hypothetical protein